jgi:hypothetical protein
LINPQETTGKEHSQFPHLKLDEEPVARCKNGEAGTRLRLDLKHHRLHPSFRPDSKDLLGTNSFERILPSDYSLRSATIGSTLAARRAGITVASSAATPSSTVDSASMTGSQGLTPNN